MHALAKDHIERVKTAVQGSFGLGNLDSYIERKTYLNGKLFSFKDHEFQRDVLKSNANTEITVKIAQVGLSEVSYRLALAAIRVMDDFSVIYTFPNAGDAQNFCKTRIDPIITGSPDLAQAVNPDLNNSEIKQFGRNSFLYMKGTNSERGAISVPADMVIHDEWDRSDTSTASMYLARLQHKPHKLRKLFSTPTFAKYGILLAAETATRYRHMAACLHCSFKWVPDYFQDVKIPGYSGDLKELTAHNIKDLRWREAYIACPRCGKDPKLAYERMEWVAENLQENYDAIARFISPFSVPNIITPAYLVKNSTEHKKYSEFMNQALGLAAEADDENLSEQDIELAKVPDLQSNTTHVFGADMGLTCHVVIAREAEGKMLVAHKERIPLGQFEQRRIELLRQYRCTTSVHDSQPYVDLISRLTQRDPNAHGAIFASFKSGPVLRIQEEDEDAEEGKMNFRLVKLRRNEALDMVMALFKRREILVQNCPEQELYKQHMLNMKRMQKFSNEGDMHYAWVKTGDEEDHYHFATLYAWAALKIRGTASTNRSLLGSLPLINKVRMRTA